MCETVTIINDSIVEHGTFSVCFRLVADILNDVATFLELLAPLFPALFLYIVCVASVSKVYGTVYYNGYSVQWRNLSMRTPL